MTLGNKTEATRKRPSGETIFKRLMFLIGLVSIVIMLLTFDVSWQQLHKILFESWWLPVVVLLMWAPLYLMNAYAWLVILRGQGPCQVSLPMMYKWTITGFALNSLTPMGLLGSEPYKIVELKERVGTERATSSVLLLAMMHIYSHFWFWATALVVFIGLAAFGIVRINVGIAIILLLGALFIASCIYIFRIGYRNGFLLKLLHGLGHLPGLRRWAGRMESKYGEAIGTVDRQISELRGQNPRTFRKAFALEYIGRILQSFEVFFILISLGVSVGSGFWGLLLLFVFSFIMLAFTSLFANLLGFIPMQLGSREGGYAMAAAWLGLTSGIGLTVSIVCRLREIIWDIVGMALMTKMPKIKNA